MTHERGNGPKRLLETVPALFMIVASPAVMPGTAGPGPAAGAALLLPLTFGPEPVTAVMMLACVMHGGQNCGTLTSVLINMPGEASDVLTVLDGHAMAQQGGRGQHWRLPPSRPLLPEYLSSRRWR